MTKPNIQIDGVVREMTEEEYQAYLVDQEIVTAELSSKESKLASKESALAKLAALGLTEEEIAAL